MSTVLIILAVVCALVGIAGAILPGLPGVPVSWLGLLLLDLSHAADYTPAYLIIYAAVALIITILDYVIPIIGTKQLGGTKAGTKGSTWGLVVGIIVLPLLGITLGPMGIIGILGGPFLGAYLGEKWKGNKEHALKSAFGSFIGFLAGTIIKTAYGIVVLIVIIKDIIT
jgi:uncharacterized protein YqgC (DUF456 family)